MTKTLNDANERINILVSRWSGKVITVAVTIIISIMSMLYTDMKTRVGSLEERTTFILQDKVSRAEFKDEMTQMRLQIEGIKTDIITRQQSMKKDILDRLDLMQKTQK